MKFLMHPLGLDVCLRERADGGYEWWNLGYEGHPWYIQDAVKPRNLAEWVDITKSVTKKRTKKGIPE